MATGIRDRVAIIGMGCPKFGERWHAGAEAPLAEAFEEALADAGVERRQIEAAWFGSRIDGINVGNSAIPASTALRLDGIPVSRMETMCATGTQTPRGAAHAVASGAVDIALPCQIDGGLKCFGHPIGASGPRMAYETCTQLLGRAGKRQLATPSPGLTHNLGGAPYLGVAAISILGLA
jgi:acetyl-CoA acetyltransferase